MIRDQLLIGPIYSRARNAYPGDPQRELLYPYSHNGHVLYPKGTFFVPMSAGYSGRRTGRIGLRVRIVYVPQDS